MSVFDVLQENGKPQQFLNASVIVFVHLVDEFLQTSVDDFELLFKLWIFHVS